jgi:hypothetical protein
MGNELAKLRVPPAKIRNVFAKVRSVHSGHLLNVLLQIENKLGLSKKI